MVNKSPYVRELYTSEVEYKDNLIKEAGQDIELMDELLGTVKNATQYLVQSHKQKEFKERLYVGGQRAPFRYFGHEDILGFNRFDLYSNAYKAGMAHNFEDLIKYFLKTVDHKIILRGILLQALSLKSYPEVKFMFANKSVWEEWFETVSYWYLHLTLLVMFLGKKREEYFQTAVAGLLKKYNNIKLAKTKTYKDQLYMIDFVFLDDNNDPLAGISIKSAGYHWGGDHQYVKSGEKRERTGHKQFREDFDAPVITVISQPEAPGNAGLLGIAGDVMPLLNTLEEAGIISRK